MLKIFFYFFLPLFQKLHKGKVFDTNSHSILLDKLLFMQFVILHIIGSMVI